MFSKEEVDASTGSSFSPKAKKLQFEISSNLVQNLEKSCANFDRFVNQFSLKVMPFKHFGKETIKQFKLSIITS